MAMSIRHILLAILVTAVWGFNFVVIHWGLGDMPPLLLSAMRFLVAAVPAVFFVKRPDISWGALGAITFFHVSQFNLLFFGMSAGLIGGNCLDCYSVAGVFHCVVSGCLAGRKTSGSPGRRHGPGFCRHGCDCAFKRR